MRYTVTEWEKEEREGELEDFIGLIPGLLSYGLVPQMAVVNDALATGHNSSNAPLVEWSPFQLTADQYSDLANRLETAKGLHVVVDIPQWVDSMEQWQVYAMHAKFNVPIDQHRSYLERLREAQSADGYSQVQGAGDSPFNKRHFEAQQAYAEFLSSYLRTQ